MTTLYDSNEHSDAVLGGYDRTYDPIEDGEGLTITGELCAVVGPCVTLVGPDGQAEIIGWAELGQVIERLQDFKAACERRVAAQVEVA